MKEIDFITNHKIQFLNFFRSKFPTFHNSVVFYRDIRYAADSFLISGGFRPSDAELEAVANALIKVMVSDGVFKAVTDESWTLNYPEFHTTKPGKPSLNF